MHMRYVERKKYGWAIVEPTTAIIAGSYGTWRLIYTAGQFGLDNTGMLLVCWRFAWDWGRPQTSNPSGENFLTARTNGEADLLVAYTFKGYTRPWYHAVQVEVVNGEVGPGEHIEVILGDTSHGSPGQRAPTAVGKCEWRVFVDCFATRRFVPLDVYPTLEVVSGEARRLVAILPTDAVEGKGSWAVVRVEDAWGNPATDYRGTVNFLWEKEGKNWSGIPSQYTFTESDRGVKWFEGVVPRTWDVCRLRVVDETKGWKALSNPCQCHDKPVSFQHFWGDLHGQSGEALGLGSSFDYFRFARDVAALDFASNQGNDFDITKDGWRRIQQAAKSFNEHHRFVTFLGCEWSGNTSGGGDRNVIFLKDDEVIRRSSHGNLEDLSDLSTDCYPISELFQAFSEREDVILIPHVGGRYANLRFHEPSLEPAIEIYSGWGLFEWFLSEALKQGMKVGFVAGSDDHRGRPGAASPGAHIFGVYGGLTCVLAKELTREEIFESLKARRCYATSGQRILLEATCNGHQMGEELEIEGNPTFRCRVIGTEGIQSVEILRSRPGCQEAEVVYSHPVDADMALSDSVKIAWRGLRQRHRYFQTVWDGSLTLSDGRILAAKGHAFDTPHEGIIEWTEKRVTWRSRTVGDEDGVILALDAPPKAHVKFETEPYSFELKWSDIGLKPIVFEAGGIGQEVLVKRLPAVRPPWDVSFSWIDERPSLEEGAYYLKVIQIDGALAYSSPFYVRRPKTRPG